MSEEDKNYVNEWDIIDTFFRDTPYYKSQHQIDLLMNFYSQKKMVYTT